MSEVRFPADFEQRMHRYLGDEWQEFAAAHLEVPPVSIRINPRKIKSHEFGDPIPWTSTGFYLKERPSFTLDPAFHAGSYYVQEASSMFLEQAFLQSVDQTKSLRVLDLCAAPGGKSTHLLSLMNNQSLLVSNELIRSRASILVENIQKWGYDNVVVTNNDPQDFQRLQGFFDVIVVDAPCSGEGLFRKNPKAMQEWSIDNAALCARRQRRVLNDVWPALKQEGILIYSTCTYNESENEEIMGWLKNEHDVEFLPLKLDEKWGAHQIGQSSSIGYGFYPHNVLGEGLFISLLRKTAEEKESRLRKPTAFASPSKKNLDAVVPWLLHPGEKTFIMRNDKIQFFPKNKMHELEFLAENLYLLTAGTMTASVKRDKLIPEHAASLSIELNAAHFNSIDVDRKDALQFLRKETMRPMSDKKGFALICYNGHPLGWVNVLNNRLNNLYPSEWRIRMTDTGPQ